MTQRQWEPTIGLEVHVQLQTRTKLFCRCERGFGAEPNTRVCPVCLGHPGVLPVLNRAAVTQAVRAAMALDLQVQRESKFDRKNYFYPDLPKGYQISQFDEPIALHGHIDLENGRRIGIARLHMEEDAGKTVHDRGAFGLVDFNRAGTPLAEIVSEPDLAAPDEAREYLEQMKQRLRYAGVSDCDMEKGNLRVDVNVSVAPPGQRATGTRTEIKNVNSFASVVLALRYEIQRQIDVLEAGGAIRQETRTWDEQAECTRVMRVKEEADDYRYFPEPDLPRLALDPEWIAEQERALPEAAASRHQRYVEQLGLSAYDAGVLTAERATAEYFERVVAAGVAAKEAANWISNEILKRLPAERDLEDFEIDSDFLVASLALLQEEKTNRKGVQTMLDARLQGDERAPAQLLTALGLEVQRDSGELEAICKAAIEAQPKAAEDVRNGAQKALGALMGHVMKATRGAADPGMTRKILLELLS